jgi:hypothetical protein
LYSAAVSQAKPLPFAIVFSSLTTVELSACVLADVLLLFQ